MVLAGEYEDVRRFIHALETAPEFILVEEVVLSHGNETKRGSCSRSGCRRTIGTRRGRRRNPGHEEASGRDALRRRRGGPVPVPDMKKRPGVMRPLRARVRSGSGYSFVELLVVTAIVLVLASAVMPLTRVTMQRQREAELRRGLREMRTAIDRYKDAVDFGVIGGFDVEAGNEGYPPSLEVLVEGVEVLNDASGRRMRFLRRIPFESDDAEPGVGAAFV